MYQTLKALEDGKGEVLRSSTGVVHDVKTNNLWMGGIMSRFVVVCEPSDAYPAWERRNNQSPEL
jgi:hypothetical protein